MPHSSFPLRRAGAVALFLCGAAAPLAAQDRVSKLDPRLQVFRSGAAVSRVMQLPQLPSAGQPVALPAGTPRITGLTLRRASGETYVDAFVSLTDRSPAVIEAAGGLVRVQAGSLIGAWLPLSALVRLEQDPRVRYIRAANRITVKNDAAMADIHADAVRTRTGTGVFTGSAGAGTIVGIFDTGIDWHHADFKKADGKTRILYLWDMTDSTATATAPGVVGGQPFNTGNECSAAQIDASNCAETDTNGHGTHVSGSAAGGGGSSGQFAGVAPMADLVVVKGGNGSFSSLDVVAGIQYIFKRADLLGRPAVVNLSLGGQASGHDGTSPEEQAIDSLSGPGHIVVVAAGNEASNGTDGVADSLTHATRTLGTGDTAQIRLTIGGYQPVTEGVQNNVALFDFWYDARDSVTIKVTRPNGTSLSATTGDTIVVTADPQGEIEIDNAAEGLSPMNGDREIFVALFDGLAGHAPAQGNWAITITMKRRVGNGRFDVWEFTRTVPAAFTGGGDNGYMIGFPGSAERAITVAAHTTKTSWAAQGGTFHFTSHPPVGELAGFSSGGPTRPVRDAVARQKPEISAPGTAIMSTRSAQLDPNSPENVPALTSLDGTHVVMQGTSMATPMVTGSVALMLERNPSLTPEDVKSIIETTARQDAFTAISHTGGAGGVPNASWGYGKLDVQAALAATAASTELQVAAGPRNASLATRVVLPRSDAPSLQLRLTGSATDDITLTSVTLRSTGTGNDATGVSQVKLYVDADSNGVVGAGETLLGSVAIPSDNGEVAFTGLGLALPAGSTTYLLAAYTFASPVHAQTFALNLEGAARIGAVKVSDLSAISFAGAAVNGGVLTIQGVGTLAASGVTLGTTTIALGQPNAVFLRLDVAAGSREGIALHRLAGTFGGNAVLASTIRNVRLIDDANGNGGLDSGEPVLRVLAAAPSSAALLADFPADSAPPVPAGTTKHWLVVGDVQAGASAGATLSFRADSLRGSGLLTDSTVRATGTPVAGATLGLITSTFAMSGIAPDSATVLRDAAALPLVRVRFDAEGEAMVIDSLRFRSAGTLAAAGIKSLRLVADLDSNGVAGTDDPVVASNLTLEGGVVKATPTAAGSIPIGTRWWVLLADGAGNATWGQTLQLHLDSADLFASRSTSGTAPVKLGAATVTGRFFTVGGAAALTLAPAAQQPAARLAIGSIPAVLVKVDASTLEGATVDALTLGASSNGNLAAFVDEVDLFADPQGTAIPTADPVARITSPFASGGSATFSSLARGIAAGGSATFLVVVKTNDRLRQGDTLGLKITGASGTGALSLQQASITVGTNASALGGAELLGADEPFLISENPVRDGLVTFSYDASPSSIKIYNFAGLLVRQFTNVPASRFEWDLRSESPGLPNGMYVVVFDAGSTQVRKRLMILSPSR